MKEQLDISIKSVDKSIKSMHQIDDFLSKEWTIEHKTDGVKLTAIKVSDEKEIDDFIFAYKGNVLFNGEHDYHSNSQAKESIGASQFKLVFEHFKRFTNNTIPVGTELFIEFLINKPTLSSNYQTGHKMVLIGYTESKYTESFGKLRTVPGSFQTHIRKHYAKQLGLDVPNLLFKGKFDSLYALKDGCVSDDLYRLICSMERDEQLREHHFLDDKIVLLEKIKHLFLSVESVYGGTEEGVVLKSGLDILKWQQSYQTDKDSRLAIKMKYREDNPSDETNYWESVRVCAEELVSQVKISNVIEVSLKRLSSVIAKSDIWVHHTKKNRESVVDDVQLSAKTMIIKRTPGNNNALVIGKFRIPTLFGHMKMIDSAYKEYDDVVICLVSNRDSKHTLALRESMIKLLYPDITIIHSTNANLIRVIQSSPKNINAVYCGTDRAPEYQEQLRYSFGIEVKCIERSERDISASKVIKNINDYEHFVQNTHIKIHHLYNKIKNVYYGQ